MWGTRLKKDYGRKCKKIYISTINENMSFCYIRAHSHKNYMYNEFIWYPTLRRKLSYVFFFFSYISCEIKYYIDHQAGLRGPDSCSCWPTIFFHFLHFFSHFAIRFNHYQDKSTDGSEKINPWCGWSAISRVQTPNEHAASLNILDKSHSACCSEKFTYCSEYSACCSE